MNAAGNPGGGLSPLDSKIQQVFGEVAVPKGLLRHVEALRRVPRFVSEYLLGMSVAQSGDPRAAVSSVEALVKEYCPLPEDRQLIRHRLLSQGQVVLLDSLSVRVDLDLGIYWASLPSLGENYARLQAPLAHQNPGLLQGGRWGKMTVSYDPAFEIGGHSYPVEVTRFEPLEGHLDLAHFVSQRRQFTLDEWVRLLLASCGYGPPPGLVPGDLHSLRPALLLLCRLLPLVEPNLNIIELGPKNTGKTYLLRNVSPHAFVISGGQTTPANLFVNLATHQLGVIGYKRAIVFDEVGRLRFLDPDATVPILKDYMESGHFSRGREQYSSDASVVLLGNLSVEGDQPDARYAHLLEELPLEIQDAAFVDRLHGFIPGWEIPKLAPSSFADGYGLLTDYFAEILNWLRTESFGSELSRVVSGRQFLPGVTRRDQVAVERIARGLLKLLHPDGEASPESADMILSLATELRQRVHNQLVVLDPGEYRPRSVGWTGVPVSAPADFAAERELLEKDSVLNCEARVGEVTALTVRVNRDGEAVAGSLQLIEVSALDRGRGGFEIVGKHGPDMEDSGRAAYNFVLSHAQQLGVPADLIRSKTVVAHLVSISTPREGPSAGLAFVIAIISAVTGVRVRPALAVTGEVSLHGRVTAVGGILHKLRAAKQHGRRTVIMPRANDVDLARIRPDLLQDIEIVPVDTVDQAISAALGLRR